MDIESVQIEPLFNSKSILESDEELQKAIDLSLQTEIKSQMQEDEDLKRALEASMIEVSATNNPHANNDANVVNPDPIVIEDETPRQMPNPPRNAHVPIGLKNVGSSCWYNAVVQVLYHVPAFRRLILQNDVDFTPEEPRDEFKALQSTFALMKETKCSWIDPQEFVRLFRSRMPTTSTQQVSSFSSAFLYRYHME